MEETSRGRVSEFYEIGADKIMKPVGSTMGAHGRLVECYTDRSLPAITTKDGITVAKNVEDSDLVVNNAINKFRTAALETNTTAGDGTTGTIVFSTTLYKKLANYVNEPFISLPKIAKGMDMAQKDILALLEEKRTLEPTDEQLRKIALVATNNDEVAGNVVYEAFKKVGFDGHVSYTQDYDSKELRFETYEGITIDYGMARHDMVGDEEKYEAKEALLVCCSKAVDSQAQLTKLYNIAIERNKDLILICRTITEGLIADVVLKNRSQLVKNAPKVIVVVAGYSDFTSGVDYIYDDITTSFDKNTVRSADKIGLENLTNDYICEVTDVTIDENVTIFRGGTPKKARVADVKKKLASKNTVGYSKDNLKQRLRVLQGSTAMIYIGGYNESEITELEHRIEDALNSVKNTYSEGFLPGGGTAFLKIKKLLNPDIQDDNVLRGYNVVKDSLDSCFKQIMANAGEDEEIKNEVIMNENFNVGYDLRTRQLTDLVEAGVLDPYKVLKCQIENGISVCKILMRTSYVLAPKPIGVSGMTNASFI